jgi:hypothetical protein
MSLLRAPIADQTTTQLSNSYFYWKRLYDESLGRWPLKSRWMIRGASCPCYTKNYGSKYCWRCYTDVSKISMQSSLAEPQSALCKAAQDGSLKWVDWLLATGATTQTCPSQPCVLDFAKRGGILQEVIQLLSGHGRDLRSLFYKSVLAMPTEGQVGWLARQYKLGPDPKVDMLPEPWGVGSKARCAVLFDKDAGFVD